MKKALAILMILMVLTVFSTAVFAVLPESPPSQEACNHAETGGLATANVASGGKVSCGGGPG